MKIEYYVEFGELISYVYRVFGYPAVCGNLFVSYEISHVASCSQLTHKWSIVLGLG